MRAAIPPNLISRIIEKEKEEEEEEEEEEKGNEICPSMVCT